MPGKQVVKYYIPGLVNAIFYNYLGRLEKVSKASAWAELCDLMDWNDLTLPGRHRTA